MSSLLVVFLKTFLAVLSINILQSVSRDQAIGQQCTAANWAHADEFRPLVSTAVIEWSDILPSSVITTSTTHRNHTIAFVGTTDGLLVKVIYNIIKSFTIYNGVLDFDENEISFLWLFQNEL